MTESISDFKEIIRKIEDKKILLPDFQREFVWRDEEQQKKIIASVLSQMPIGSILLLKSKPDEYSSIIIGCKTKIEIQELGSEVEFLLDGQQRITVLTNVFSNIIHDQCKGMSNLVSPSLKRRFFLRIPRWSKCQNERDLFGVHELMFKYKNSDSEEPDFLSGDILPFIECINFTNGDGQPYNPQVPLSTELDNFCISNAEGYLIPLYLLVPSEKVNRAQIVLRYKTILKNIARNIGEEIIDHFTSLNNDNEKLEFIDEIIMDVNERDRIKANFNLFKDTIDGREEVWMTDLEYYLKESVNRVALNKIVLKEEQRARAIDIYENLNRGGVSLNTFDLIMARVAKVSKDNFYHRMIACMQQRKKYPVNVLPEVVANIISEEIVNNSYNATMRTKCYSEKKNEIASKYIDAFLDVLSLYCYNKNYLPEEFKLDNIKRNKILNLAAEEIHLNCEIICNAIDRALFFFQTRCGIRNIQEINYSLMLVLVATIFVKDEYFEDKKVHDKLEAWYWAALFSGEYDKDQNTKMINHLQLMANTLKGDHGIDWIKSLKDDVLEMQYFSEKSFLLMEKANEDRYPKNVIKNSMCQYLLAKTYADMFEANKKISVFCKEAEELETHHIIPLGTAKKVGESTKELRKNIKHICNSPLNFVYITKSANKEISDDSLDTYINKICDEAKAALHISAYRDRAILDDELKIKELLGHRHTALKGDIKQHILNLLQ